MEVSFVGWWPWDGADLTLGDLAALLRRPDWQADGVCQEHPEVSWFPKRGESGEPAKAICRTCLVRAECQSWALDQDHLGGIWGGLSERERQRLRPRRVA